MCWAPFSALYSISTCRAPARLGHDCDSSDFADGKPGGLGWSWGSPIGMHWGTARPSLLSTALVHSRHSEGAAPEAEGMRAALRPSVAVGRATIPPSACCGLRGAVVTPRWLLTQSPRGGAYVGTPWGASQPTRCPRGTAVTWLLPERCGARCG